jgi:hypothetical protein
VDRGGETAELEVSELLSFLGVVEGLILLGDMRFLGCLRVVICGQDVVLSMGRLVC